MENSTRLFMEGNTTLTNEVASNQVRDMINFLQMILGYSIIVLNSISILVLVRSSKMMFSVRIPAINMAISDTLIGISLCTPDIVKLFGHFCVKKSYSLLALYQVSTLIVTMMNTDRFLSLRFPFKYSKLVSRRNVLFGCLMCWLIGFLSPIAENNCRWTDLNERKSFQWTSVFFLLVISVNIFEYCYVIHFSITATVGKINKKCIRKVSLYTGCYVLCTIPYMIIQLIHTLSTNPTPLLLVLKKFFARLTFVTSFLNPILYCVLFTECRLQLRIILCFWNKKLLNIYKRKAKEHMCTYSIQSISKSVEFRS